MLIHQFLCAFSLYTLHTHICISSCYVTYMCVCIKCVCVCIYIYIYIHTQNRKINRYVENGIDTDIEFLISEQESKVSWCLAARNRKETYSNKPYLKPLDLCSDCHLKNPQRLRPQHLQRERSQVCKPHVQWGIRSWNHLWSQKMECIQSDKGKFHNDKMKNQPKYDNWNLCALSQNFAIYKARLI